MGRYRSDSARERDQVAKPVPDVLTSARTFVIDLANIGLLAAIDSRLPTKTSRVLTRSRAPASLNIRRIASLCQMVMTYLG